MKKLLFIRYRKSGQIDAGGEQVANANYEVLCRILGEENIEVYYIHQNQNESNVFLSAFSILSNFLKGYYYGLSPHKVGEIVRSASDYSYVFIDRSIFGIIAKALKESSFKGKIITFFHNVESVFFAAKISKYAPWRPIVLNCVKENDKYSCDFSDVIIALNQRDQQMLEKLYKRSPDILTPVVFKDSYRLTAYPKGMTRAVPVCLFLGTYFPMNVRGILWFVKEVLPFVRIKLQIVGKGMSAILPMVKEYEQVEVFSDVPDLRPYIEDADFMLLPIFEGSGMKVKTCEALMYGKNIIATTEAFEGYDLDYEKVGACCNTKDEFIRVLKDKSIHPSSRFNAYARQVFVENYSEEERKKRFEGIFK